MKRYILLLFSGILGVSAVLSTERILKGIIVDNVTQTPIEYASILLLDKDSTFLKGGVSENNGFFTIAAVPDNAAIVKISFVGYNEAYFTFDNKNIEQENCFHLQPTILPLEEVSITANRKICVIKDDKIIFDPSFVAYAINAADIIRQVPGIMDTGNSLVMPGKDAIKICINGKEQKGSLDDVLLLLKSYPSSDIEVVEIVTNPSTQYTMGRNVGIINIKLKKRPNDYLGGNAAYQFSYDTKMSNEGSFGIFHQGKKLSSSINVAKDIKEYDLEEKNTINFTDYSRLARTSMGRHSDDLVLRWNLHYQMNDKWNTGLSAYYAKGEMKQDAIHRYNYSFSDSHNQEEFVNGKRADNSDVYCFSFDLDGQLSNISNLAINVDYYHKGSPTERTFHNYTDKALLEYSSNDIDSDNLTTRINYNIAPKPKLSLNLGVDGIITNSENFEMEKYQEGTAIQYSFNYNETELDLYGEARYKFNTQWMLRSSIRYQSIWTEIKTNQANANLRNFDAICPSAFLSYLFKEDQSIQLGFYSNINKPTLTAINPSELYIGKNTYRKGNPNLRHSKHHVVNLTYSFGNFMMQPFVEWLDNGITEISTLKDNSSHMMTWENAVDHRNIGLMTFYSYSTVSWIRASITSFLSNSVTTSNHQLLQPRISSLKFSVYPNLQFYFENEKKWTLSIFGYYTTPEHTVDMKLESLWKFSSSLTWKPNKEWAVSLIGQDLLYSHTRGIQYIGDSMMKFDNQYIYSGVQLSVSYTWGKTMKRSAERTVLKEMNTRTELD